MAKKDLMVITVSEGEKIRLTRLMLGLRQVDVVSLARVSISSVTGIEKGRWVPEDHRERILGSLRLLEEQEQPETSDDV